MCPSDLIRGARQSMSRSRWIYLATITIGTCLFGVYARASAALALTSQSNYGTATVQALDATEWLRGQHSARLTFQTAQGTFNADLLDTLLHRAVLITVDPDRPRLFCLYDFDTGFDLLVFEPKPPVFPWPHRVGVMVRTSNMHPHLASPTELVAFRTIVSAMPLDQFVRASVPWFSIGPFQLARGRNGALRAANRVFPVSETGSWLPNGFGETRSGGPFVPGFDVWGREHVWGILG